MSANVQLSSICRFLSLDPEQESTLPQRRALSGDILAELRPRVRALVASLPQRGTLTEDDLEQQACLEILRLLPGYQPARGEIWSWLYVPVRRALCRAIRRQGHVVHLSDRDAGVGGVGAWPVVEDVLVDRARPASDTREQRDLPLRVPDRDALEQLLQHEEHGAARDAVASLPPRLHALVCRVYGIGRPEESLSEIAHAAGCSRTPIARQLEQALTLLREALSADADR